MVLSRLWRSEEVFSPAPLRSYVEMYFLASISLHVLNCPVTRNSSGSYANLGVSIQFQIPWAVRWMN